MAATVPYEELRDAVVEDAGEAGELLGGAAAGAFATAIVAMIHGLVLQWLVDPGKLVESLSSVLDLE